MQQRQPVLWPPGPRFELLPHGEAVWQIRKLRQMSLCTIATL